MAHKWCDFWSIFGFARAFILFETILSFIEWFWIAENWFHNGLKALWICTSRKIIFWFQKFFSDWKCEFWYKCAQNNFAFFWLADCVFHLYQIYWHFTNKTENFHDVIFIIRPETEPGPLNERIKFFHFKIFVFNLILKKWKNLGKYRTDEISIQKRNNWKVLTAVESLKRDPRFYPARNLPPP